MDFVRFSGYNSADRITQNNSEKKVMEKKFLSLQLGFYDNSQ